MSEAILNRARQYQEELAAIRRDIHAHPELGLEEHRTAELVAQKLGDWGIEVHRGVGGTGVVGVLRSGNGQASVGLRADMDAFYARSNGAALRQPESGSYACLRP
jgi:metal-dependent amidase/aminoacylase/carboxypeptidase family protein